MIDETESIGMHGWKRIRPPDSANTPLPPSAPSNTDYKPSIAHSHAQTNETDQKTINDLRKAEADNLKLLADLRAAQAKDQEMITGLRADKLAQAQEIERLKSQIQPPPMNPMDAINLLGLTNNPAGGRSILRRANSEEEGGPRKT